MEAERGSSSRREMLYDYVERKRKENSGAQLHVTYLVSGSLIQNGHSSHLVSGHLATQVTAGFHHPNCKAFSGKQIKRPIAADIYKALLSWNFKTRDTCKNCYEYSVSYLINSVKSKLAVTASIHVYSIQKAMLKDSGPLFNTDYDILKSNLQNCSNSFVVSTAVPRSPAESSSSSKKFEQSHLNISSETQANNEPTTNGHGPALSKQVSQQPKGIMGLFASKAATKTQEINKEAKTEAKEITNASSAGNKAPGKGNVMSNFFGKAAMNKLKVSLDSEQAVKEEKIVEQPTVSVIEPKLAAPAGLKKSSKKAEPVKMLQKEKKSCGQVAEGKRVALSDDETKETENMKKKRRRIKLPESDSSEDEGANWNGFPYIQSVEDLGKILERSLKPSTLTYIKKEIQGAVFPDSPGVYEAESPSPPPPVSPPLEPVPETEPEPPSVKSSSGENKRKRKRVLKSKTYVDEDAFIAENEIFSFMTEKVYESESCTDSEEELKMKTSSVHRPPAMTVKKEPKEERKGPKKGTAALGKANRQVSITGFFQRK
ncbi:DNA polymerase delta subunit 3 [Saguinus oedipus]|uniref:DNA polymerase delta subunit 3 n=1 Tax=Saguinus oedipus TaxID=9490 RepID=A0ABQ9UXK5_SAGOE|nr:DNA polymerase delta subunit 3 [Saguinus oedipus]